MTAAIQFENVTKKYRRKLALDDVSFEVPAGSVFAMLGDNGAGKTTSIKSMMGFVRPEKGSVNVFNLNSKKQDHEIRSRVGYVPEQPELYDWMRVDEIGWFVAGVRQGDFYDNFKKQIEQFSIPLTSKISQLSKGMKAKISLALATSHHPEVLILDEPTSGLDPLVRREFMESMVDRAATGTTVFLSSHQLNEVERVAEYVAFMKEGKLLFVEKLADLKNQTAELTITFSDSQYPDPDMAARKIHCRSQGRQKQFLVRDFETEESLVRQINGQQGVEACRVTRPSLEQIVVGYLSSDGTELVPENTASSVAVSPNVANQSVSENDDSTSE